MGSGGTWTVPVLGGEPTRLLAGAEALSFIPRASGPPRVLFSELEDLNGVHLSIKTAAQNRSESRLVYSPPEQAMAIGRIFRRTAERLVVEMDGGWLPCRLAPFERQCTVQGRGPVARPVHDRGVVSGWQVDVLFRKHRQWLPYLAAAVSGRRTRTGHFRAQ